MSIDATTPFRQGGFTLIEMLISLSLGLIIIATVFSAMRVASSSVTVCDRLAISNALLRAGVFAALDETDFWTAYDDPGDVTRQRLRQVDHGTGWGLPFTPFSAVWPRSGFHVTDPLNEHYQDDGAPELERGWNPAYSWSVSDPRTWWRGCMAERSMTDLRDGRYGRFSNTSQSLDLASPEGEYGSILVPHTWLSNQIAGLSRALGYYGMIEYLPVNSIFAYYEPVQKQGAASTNDGGIPLEFLYPVYRQPGFDFCDDDGWMNAPRSLYRSNFASSFPLIPVNPTTAGWTTSTLVQAERSYFSTGFTADQHSLATFLDQSSDDEPLLRSRPASWPGVDLEVTRSIHMGRFNTACTITLKDPVNGEISEISFSSFGTTLRGARMQRGLDN